MIDRGYVFLAFFDRGGGVARDFLEAITKATRLIVASPPLATFMLDKRNNSLAGDRTLIELLREDDGIEVDIAAYAKCLTRTEARGRGLSAISYLHEANL